MALFNCPECNKLISDQAFDCPQCGYPVASKRIIRQEVNISPENIHDLNPNQLNKELIVALTSKKSEGLAFLFTLLFGPLGLFYADSKKAVMLIISIILCIALLIALGIDISGIPYLAMSIAFWIISVVLAITSVTEHNDKISSGLVVKTPDMPNATIDSISNVTASIDPVQKLERLIRAIHEDPSKTNFYKESIIHLISENCDDKSDCLFLMKEYRNRYKCALIDELKSLSHSYDSIKSYLRPFIDFEVVSKTYPHQIL